jgi:hypothetical protein
MERGACGSGAAKHRSRNKWRKLPACDDTIYRKLEAYATVKSDSYFSNGAYQDFHVLAIRDHRVPMNSRRRSDRVL